MNEFLKDRLRKCNVNICVFCKREMTKNDELWYWGGMNDILCHKECYFNYRKV